MSNRALVPAQGQAVGRRLPLLALAVLAVLLFVGWLAGGPEAAVQAWHRARLTWGQAATPQERELLALPETPGWSRARIIEEFVWAERYFERTFFRAEDRDPEALAWITGRFLNPNSDRRLDTYQTWVTPQKLAMLAADQARTQAGLSPEDVPTRLASLGYPDPQVATFAAIYRTYLARDSGSPPAGEPLSEVVARYLTGR